MVATAAGKDSVRVSRAEESKKSVLNNVYKTVSPLEIKGAFKAFSVQINRFPLSSDHPGSYMHLYIYIYIYTTSL